MNQDQNCQQNGRFYFKNKEQHACKNALEIDVGGINLKDIVLSDNVTEHFCSCELREMIYPVRGPCEVQYPHIQKGLTPPVQLSSWEFL
jgi:hypothetical protein